MEEKKSRFWRRAERFFEHRGWRVISADQLEHLQYEEKEMKRYLHESCELDHRVKFLEKEFLKKFKASDLLGIVFGKDACPHYCTSTFPAHEPNMPRGTCMKYGSYGHINLQLPWGMSPCTLKHADTCPIFNHDVPLTYGIKDDPKHPYGTRWWPKINGTEEQIAAREDFERIWQWLRENNKATLGSL